MSQFQRDEGVVKYQAIHQHGDLPLSVFLNPLDEVRTRLFDLGFVGIYPDAIGYGNVSIRHDSGCIISGTATGALRVLGIGGYCYVKSFDLHQNTAYTQGPVMASSESMTHCAIYQAQSLVQCVLHIHNLGLWKMLLDQGYASTPADIPYGTPQMALNMASLVATMGVPSGLLVMAGHEEGIIAYGQSISSAFDQIRAILPN